MSTMTKDIEVVRKLAKPAPKVYPLANPTEIKKNQLHTFSSPQPFNSGKKVPSTPFSPLFTQASTSNFLSSPANDFGSPVSKLDFISANPVNVSWSSSKIYQNNTPSKIGLNGSYQQSPTTKVTANFVNTPKPADTTTINPPEPVKLSEEEEKACNELLRKQGELLVEAKRKVEDLEKKLSNMKLEADTTSYLK